MVLVGAAAPPAVGWALATGVAVTLGTAALAWRAQAVRGWILGHARLGRQWLAALVNLAESLKDRARCWPCW